MTVGGGASEAAVKAPAAAFGGSLVFPSLPAHSRLAFRLRYCDHARYRHRGALRRRRAAVRQLPSVARRSHRGVGLHGADRAGLRAVAPHRSGYRAGAGPREPFGDRCDCFPRLEEPVGQHGGERAGSAARPHPRYDFRARHGRRHHLLEPRRRGAVRLAAGRAVGRFPINS